MRMKRIIIIAVIFFFVGGAGGYFLSERLGKESVHEDVSVSAPAPDKQAEEDERYDEKLKSQESISRIDYPLIDIYFESDKTYKVTVTEYMTNTVVKEYSDKGEFFEFNKEYFSILTVPSGRGTTPEYMLDIYEGEKRIKTLDCSMIREGVMDDRW